MDNNLSPKLDDVLDFIKQRNNATVNDICKALGVSESTVRRSLAILEEKMLIKRYHGGAKIKRNIKKDPPVANRIQEHINEKDAIGRVAATLIKPDDKIVLSGGSTVQMICKYITDIPNLTVITDSVLVIYELLNADNINLIILGGTLNRQERSIEGNFALQNMRMLRANKAFLGTKSININSGFLTDDLNSFELLRTYISNVEECIMVADHSKFYRDGLVHLLNFSDTDTFITDSKTPAEYIKHIEKEGCEVISIDI